jgi:TPP-dependent pyruvate/acetoin dehydrogenase alpha subunit
VTATCTGSFHEGLGFASVFDLPIVYIISNNQFALSTSPSYHSKGVKNLSEKARGYGIPYVTVDGMDVVAVAEVVHNAIQKARDGGGPTLIEAITYRYYGHHLGDPGTEYRTEQEIEEAKKKDPIKRMRNHLMQEGVLTESENEKLLAEVSKEIDRAIEFALTSKEAEPEDALKDIYIES